MASRIAFERSAEVGVFANITNKYALCASGGSENFYSEFESTLSTSMPVISVSIGQTTSVGSLTVGNSKGLLVPAITTDMELQVIRNSLPDSVKI